VSKITMRVRAVIGAMGILAFASPVAAQTHHRGAEMRYAAQWVQRGGAWRDARPIRGARWRAAGWGYGYRAFAPRWGYRVVAPRWGYGVRAPRWGYRVWDPPFPPRMWPRPWVRPPYRAIRRPWGRAWISARYRVG